MMTLSSYKRILSFDVGISSLSYCLIRYHTSDDHDDKFIINSNNVESDTEKQPLKVNDLKKRNLIVPKIPVGSSISDIQKEFKKVKLSRVMIEKWENINICEDNGFACKDNNKLLIDKIIMNLVKTLVSRKSIFTPPGEHLDYVLVEKQFFNPMNRSSVKGSLKNSNISFSIYTYFFSYALRLKEEEKNKKCSVLIFSAREKLKVVKNASKKRTYDDKPKNDDNILVLEEEEEDNDDDDSTDTILRPITMVKLHSITNSDNNDDDATTKTTTNKGKVPKKKYNHTTNKKLGIIRAFYVLDNGISNGQYWRKRLLITKKQDDLSDSLLQGLAFIEKNGL